MRTCILRDVPLEPAVKSTQARCLSNTMNPSHGAPPASLAVVARSRAGVDAWATTDMVLGPEAGAALSGKRDLDALISLRDDDGSTKSV